MNECRLRLRSELGAALRQLRHQSALSLEDVQQMTAARGIPVTRSHLSRVETGFAELSLPRLLALYSALGLPLSEAIDRWSTLLDRLDLPASSDRTVRSGTAPESDPAEFSRHCRAELNSIRRDPALLARWGRAERLLGRWRAAERALDLRAHGAAPIDPALIAERAVTQLALQSAGWARALLDGARARNAGGQHLVVIECAIRLEQGDLDGALPLATRVLDTAGDDLIQTSAALLLTLLYRRRGQLRAAAHSARTAWAACRRTPIAVADAAPILAASLDDGVRSAMLEAARSAARSLRAPALLSRVQQARELAALRSSDPRAAAEAARLVRSILARAGADPLPPTLLPLQTIALLAEGAETESLPRAS